MTDAVVVYRSEAFYGDVLTIDVAVADIGEIGCDFLFRMVNKASGKEIARGKDRDSVLQLCKSQALIGPGGIQERVPADRLLPHEPEPRSGLFPGLVHSKPPGWTGLTVSPHAKGVVPDHLPLSPCSRESRQVSPIQRTLGKHDNFWNFLNTKNRSMSI